MSLDLLSFVIPRVYVPQIASVVLCPDSVCDPYRRMGEKQYGLNGISETARLVGVSCYCFSVPVVFRES